MPGRSIWCWVLGSSLLFYSASAVGTVRVTCRDGVLGASERSGRRVVASVPVCDLDGATNAACMFVLSTGLRCAECPQTLTYVLPLSGRRSTSSRVDRMGRTVTRGGAFYRLKCIAADS